MKASILTVGDEILIGQIANTNAAWIGSRLTVAGVEVTAHHVSGDSHESISRGLELCMGDGAELLIVTGGLGPTHDDITVEAVARHLKLELVRDEEWIGRMRAYFESRGRQMNALNEKQALLPRGCTRIDNAKGTAPGAWIETAKTKIALLPGVPYEMQTMMENFVLPRVGSGGSYTQRILFTTGIGESVLAGKVEELGAPIREILSKEKVQLAWLPSPSGVKLRLSSREKDSSARVARVEAHLLRAIAPYVFAKTDGFEEEKLEASVGKLLKAKKFTIATAESCTGGLIADLLTNVPGSSSYVLGGIVAYANQAKIDQLGVDEKLIAAHGAVSEEVARAMAEGARKKFNATIGIGVTGIAGPDGGTPEKPVGTVWIAVSDSVTGSVRTEAKKFLFEQDRLRNKERTAAAALNWVRSITI